MFNGPAGGTQGLLVVIPVGLIFLAISMFLILSPLWAWWRATRACYVLTNRRAIVWSCAWYGGVLVRNYTAVNLTRMRRADSWIYGRGAGDLIFHTTTIVTVSSGRYGSGVSTRQVHYGFLAIDNVRDVEKLMRETLIDKFMDRVMG